MPWLSTTLESNSICFAGHSVPAVHAGCLNTDVAKLLFQGGAIHGIRKNDLQSLRSGQRPAAGYPHDSIADAVVWLQFEGPVNNGIADVNPNRRYPDHRRR